MLGPASYGDFNFLLYSFIQLTSFISTGNNFLATRLATNNYNKSLISFYWNYVIIALFISVLGLIIASLTSLHEVLFPNQALINIWIIFVLAFVMLIVALLNSMSDTCGLTKYSSIATLIVRLISVCFLLIIFFIFKVKSILGLFAYQYLLFGLLAIGLFGLLLRKKIPIYPFSVSLIETKKHIKPYFEYTRPLFFASIIVLPLSFLSRWLLQKFGGSIEQGYFSISDNISSFIILFSNSLSPLLLREFSISFNNNDNARMSSLFVKSLYALFAFTAYMSIFLMFQASKVIIFLGGDSFNNAILPVSIMILYPIPYIVNNILYAVLNSTNRTKLLSNVSIILNSLGVIFLFILIAPNKFYGLGLGAVGYAIYSVTITSIISLVMLIFCVSILKLSWIKIIINQLIVLIIFLTLGYLAVTIGDYVTINIFFSFILSGCLYTLAVFTVFLQIPTLFGISFSEIIGMVKKRLSNSA